MSAWALALAACLAQFDGPQPLREPPPEPQSVTARELLGKPRTGTPSVVVEDVAKQRPVPVDWSLPGYRVHVFASEELPVDALRRLVRPGVTLWLQTRSNMLRGSTVDTLRRAESAWIQLRPPVLNAHWDQLARLPRSGVWVESGLLADPSLGRRGPHPLAVEVTGPVPVDALRASRPAVVRYRVPVTAAEAMKVPGVRHLWEGVTEEGACAQPEPLLKIRLDAPWNPRCGRGVLAQVVRAEPAVLRALFVAQPDAELVVEVQDSEAAARGAAKLLELLDAAVGRGAGAQ